jgi:two-component system heavy metal sensor histidine kinase CusS
VRIRVHSLRFKLALLYVIFTLTSMTGLGLLSFWSVGRMLASSRYETMLRRQQRLIDFVQAWPKQDHTITLKQKLYQLSLAIAPTDAIQVYDLTGKLLYSSPTPEPFKLGWRGGDCFAPCLYVVQKGGHALRTLNQVVTLDGQRVRLSLTGMTDEHYDILRGIRNCYLICCPLLLIASLAGGVLLSHRALRPIHRIINQARTIGIQDLRQRIPVPNTGDDLELLALTWNDLLARLEIAVSRLTQFTSDISHDLRTTVTVMLTTAEFALRRERADATYREALNTIVKECQTTSQLLDDLLAASRVDIVQRNIEFAPVNMVELAREVCEHLRAIAETKNHRFKLQFPDDAWVQGDLSMLRRLINILLDNAIKYTPASGAIVVSLKREETYLSLSVSDTGIGIPTEALSRIFDRFYRVDEARSRDDSSSGLGLSIAKWIVEAHNGAIDVSSALGVGTTFVVNIPLDTNGRLVQSSAQRSAIV